MLRIAVVEDDKTYAAQLKEYLVRYGTEKNQKISVALFPDGEDIVTDYSAEFDIFDGCRKDVYGQGMTTARESARRTMKLLLYLLPICHNMQFRVIKWMHWTMC